MSHSLRVSSNHSISITQTWFKGVELAREEATPTSGCRLASERYVPSTTNFNTSTGAPVTRLVERLTESKLRKTCRGRYKGLQKKLGDITA